MIKIGIDMKSILLVIIINSCFMFSLNSSNEDLLEFLKQDENWTLIETKDNNLRIFEKDIPRSNLNALKVEKIVEIDTDKILEVVMDISNYPDVMDNSSMTSYIIGKKDDNIYAYNKFPIPFPFISSRHYFFKINQISSNEINWTLVDNKEAKSSSMLIKILKDNDEAVYIDNGAGVWKIDKISDNLSKVSYSLYMDSGGSLSDYINDLLASQSIVLLFNGVLKKSRSI